MHQPNRQVSISALYLSRIYNITTHFSFTSRNSLIQIKPTFLLLRARLVYENFPFLLLLLSLSLSLSSLFGILEIESDLKKEEAQLESDYQMNYPH